jgi:S1-C subfamily serine protease
MESVLRMHERAEKVFSPRSQDGPRFVRDVPGSRRGGHCLHCHQVKEILNNDLQRTGKWERDMAWRYPPPVNLGFDLEMDRGNVVKETKHGSPAATAGLQAGDILRLLNGVPVHSFADAQFALDRAPKTGSVEVVRERDEQVLKDRLPLFDGWRKADATWRASTRRLLGSARLYGLDLTPEEKQALGLPVKQLAFRQKEPVSAQAQAAGIRAGDIILGVDDRPLEMELSDFLPDVRRNYLIGDRVTVHLLREGKRMSVGMTLVR